VANRNLDTAWTYGKRIIEITGFFACNGASNPVASSFKGKGWRDKTGGVVHTATGTYVLTVDDPYLDVNGFSVDLQVPSAQGNWAQPGPVANLGATTAPNVTIFTVNSSGVATDLGPATNLGVFFTITFRDSTVGFSKP
jgi:hypothetical protein